jgi:hypothetical protein
LYGFLRTDPLTGLRTLESKGRAGTLSFEDRYAIAKAVVDGLRPRGDPWDLCADLPPFFNGSPKQGYR